MVDKERYVAVLRKFWASLGRRRGTDLDDQWFQQDGATPPHIKSHCWLAERAISGKADQQEVWRRVGTSFTGLEPPWFLSVGISEGPCVSEQSSNNWWAQGFNCSKNQGNPQRGVRAIDWQFCATVASLFPTPRRSFGTYSRETITFVQSIQDYWNFWEQSYTDRSLSVQNSNYFTLFL